jgi:tetratricopeptide (TPR) repeat protein
LGFDWGEDYQLYTQMMTQRAQGAWSDLVAGEVLYREKFRNDTWCWLSLTQAYTALDSHSDAETCLEQLLDLSPGNLHSWLIGFEVYQRFGDIRSIYGLMHKAACFFKGQRTFAQVMAFFMLNLGNAELAAPYARDYHARTPDKADGLVPLMLTLMHLGRPDDIREIMDYELANAGDARLNEIRAVLETIPDLNVYLPAPLSA